MVDETRLVVRKKANASVFGETLGGADVLKKVRSKQSARRLGSVFRDLCSWSHFFRVVIFQA